MWRVLSSKRARSAILAAVYAFGWPGVIRAQYTPNQFCAGFERGYATAYKQASGWSIDPLPPLCPLEPLKNLSDPPSDYEFGYTIGYRQGFRAGSGHGLGQ